MGGNLEVFKFATYLFVPLFTMVYFGDPAWYEAHVQPVKERIWPKYEDTNKPPHTASEVQAELQRFKDERLIRAGKMPAPRPSVAANVPEERRGQFAWAEGDRRLV